MDPKFLTLAGVALTLLACSTHTEAQSLLSEDFSTDDGAFVATSTGTVTGPWIYSGGTGSWTVDGDPATSTNELTSPSVVVPSSVPVQVSFDHRYNFEPLWDGSAVRISINGGAFTLVDASAFTQNGYNSAGLNGAGPLSGQGSFNAASPDYASATLITSTFEITGLSANDTLAVQFFAAWDVSIFATPPAWELGSVSINSLIDTDGDLMPDVYEEANGLNRLVNDAAGDLDTDTLTNFQEFQLGTDPQMADTDMDGYDDNVETDTGTFVSATETGTDPLDDDTDDDGLLDGVENPLLPFVNADQTGTNPHLADSDNDTFSDVTEVLAGSNPTDPASTPFSGLNVLLAENFDDISVDSVHAFQSDNGTAPSIADLMGSNNNTAQITNLNGSNINSIAWDQVEMSATVIQISVDFRMTDDTANTDAGGCCNQAADGFGIGLFDVATYMETGAINPAADVSAARWEDPTTGTAGFPEAVTVCFDIFEGNNVRSTGPGGVTDPVANVVAPFTLNNNLFHRARIRLIADGADALLTVELVEDVNGANPTTHTVIEDARVVGYDLTTRRSRLIAGGRTGGAVVQTNLDNIELRANVSQEAFAITEIDLVDQGATSDVTVTFNSKPNRVYISWYSDDGMVTWTELDDGVKSQGDSTSFQEQGIPNSDQRRFYRVTEE